jgi:hypothetical protein
MQLKNIFFALALVAVSATSCKKFKDFGDTNVNPNVTPVPSTAALLTNVQSGLGAFATNTRGALYAQQISETQYTETSLYGSPQLDMDGTYAAQLYDLQNIININSDDATKSNASKFGSNANQIAIARILKAYIFWTITDRWGDIPYSQALNGDNNLTPKYDKQEDIYKDLVKELKEANAQFIESGTYVQGDIIYGKTPTTGTINATATEQQARWKKLANSLRMLIALRTSKVYPNAGEWAATEFSSAFMDANGYITTNTDNFVLNYPGNVAAFRHPWANAYASRTDYAQSKFFTDLMSTTGDPRQSAFGSSAVGFPYGLPRDQAVAFASANTNYARVLAANRRNNNSPLVIIGASDVLLAIAEASQRGWVTANVAGFYRTGIEQSWAEWGVTGNINTYLSNASVDLAAGNALQKIQLQQYISWYPDGIQAWANWRRTGVPTLTPTPHAINPTKQIPRRLIYGNNEYAVNLTSVNEAISRLTGGDTEVARVWWDKP